MTIRVLLQTTITPAANDWSIHRFSLLAALLRQERDESGQPVFDVTTRDRDPLGAPDTLLSNLARSDYDQLWLFAVDIGNGLSKEDCHGIDAFRARGGGVLVARDHMDLGCSVCPLAVIGAAEHFHTRNVDPTAPAVRDEPFTMTISWPNFHSGANGDYQQIEAVEPVHAALRDASAPNGSIQILPSHPHEGAVSAPPGARARVIARQEQGDRCSILRSHSRRIARRAVQLRRALFIISPITTGTRAWAHRVSSRSDPGTAFFAIPRRWRLPIVMHATSPTGLQASRRIDGAWPQFHVVTGP